MGAARRQAGPRVTRRAGGWLASWPARLGRRSDRPPRGSNLRRPRRRASRCRRRSHGRDFVTLGVHERELLTAVGQAAGEISRDPKTGIARREGRRIVIRREYQERAGGEDRIVRELEIDTDELEQAEIDRRGAGVEELEELEDVAVGRMVHDLRDAQRRPDLRHGERGLGQRAPIRSGPGAGAEDEAGVEGERGTRP